MASELFRKQLVFYPIGMLTPEELVNGILVYGNGDFHVCHSDMEWRDGTKQYFNGDVYVTAKIYCNLPEIPGDIK